MVLNSVGINNVTYDFEEMMDFQFNSLIKDDTLIEALQSKKKRGFNKKN